MVRDRLMHLQTCSYKAFRLNHDYRNHDYRNTR